MHRYRREKYAPLLPSAFLAVSYGGFGGGQGSAIDNFDDRFDFDAAAYWELRNLGFGERAAREEARSGYQQARLHNLQIMDRVAREVVEDELWRGCDRHRCSRARGCRLIEHEYESRRPPLSLLVDLAERLLVGQ